jgi:hypothetical protein
MPVIIPGAIELTYLDLEQYLAKIVGSFTRKHGGEYDEWMSLARELFVDAFYYHDPAKGSFEKTVGTFVWGRMLNYWQRQKDRARKRDKGYLLDNHPATIPEFNVGEFLEDLSGDARDVVNLVLEDAPDLRVAMAWRKVKNPTQVRYALKEVLRDLGWTASRIAESFTEIREALE